MQWTWRNNFYCHRVFISSGIESASNLRWTACSASCNPERQLCTYFGILQTDEDINARAGGFETLRGRSLKQGGFNFGNTGSLLNGINFGSLGLNFQSLDSQVHPLTACVHLEGFKLSLQC